MSKLFSFNNRNQNKGRSILVISPESNPLNVNNGISLRLYNLLQPLSIYYKMDLLTNTKHITNGPFLKKSFFKSAYGNDRLTNIRNKTTNKKRKLLPNIFPNRFSYHWPKYDPLFHNDINKLLLHRKYDLILCSLSSTYGYYLYDKRSHNVVCDVCDSTARYFYSMYNTCRQPKLKLANLYYIMYAMLWDRKYLSPCSNVIVISEHDRAWLSKSIARTNIHVVPNGVDTDYFSPKIVEPRWDSFTLCFSGVMDYEPNHDAMMHCLNVLWPKLKSIFPNLKLKIVGRDPREPLIRTATAKTDVTVTGEVPDIRSAIKGSAIFLSPMRLGAGTKNKHLEAMAMGIPLITTTEGAKGIEFIPGIHALIADTTKEIISAVSFLQGDQSQWQKLSEQGRTFVMRNHSWESSTETILDIFDRNYHTRMK